MENLNLEKTTLFPDISRHGKVVMNSYECYNGNSDQLRYLFFKNMVPELTPKDWIFLNKSHKDFWRLPEYKYGDGFFDDVIETITKEVIKKDLEIGYFIVQNLQIQVFVNFENESLSFEIDTNKILNITNNEDSIKILFKELIYLYVAQFVQNYSINNYTIVELDKTIEEMVLSYLKLNL